MLGQALLAFANASVAPTSAFAPVLLAGLRARAPALDPSHLACAVYAAALLQVQLPQSTPF